MSYKVFSDVSNALRDLLLAEFAGDATVNGIVGGVGGIGFDNPTETATHSSIKLSLWLYQVVENEFLKNDPPVQHGPDRRLMPPLPLNLFYLITPFARQSDSDLLLLGKTMEVLYDNATIILREPPANPNQLTTNDQELRVILCRLTLEELTRVWEALREPYRLSVCYQIRVTRIESQRELNGARVLERDASFGQAQLLEAR